jgi:hypothetical protein
MHFLLLAVVAEPAVEVAALTALTRPAHVAALVSHFRKFVIPALSRAIFGSACDV